MIAKYFLGRIRLAQRVFDTFGVWRPSHSYLVMQVGVGTGRPTHMAIVGLKGWFERSAGTVPWQVFFSCSTPHVKRWHILVFLKAKQSIPSCFVVLHAINICSKSSLKETAAEM